MHRRTFLRTGISAIAAALAGDLASGRAARGEVATAGGARGRACIVLWLNGGPSHLDTFDPKPGAKGGGPFRDIATRAPGVRICEHLPALAERMDRVALVRGMTSKEGNHARAQHLLHTGYAPNATAPYPAIGAWASADLADPAVALPAFMSIGGPSFGGGALGVPHGPFVVQDPSLPPENVRPPASVDAARFARRLALLDGLEARFAEATGDRRVADRRELYARAIRMMTAPGLDAFDLASEPASVRAAYGETRFGRGCLLARRLVERGVRFVEVVLDGWDTHQDNFGRTQKLMATLDPAMASLLHDLEQRELLDRTLVVCLGEFGRSPRVNEREGRDHHPQAWTAALAGGGVRGGVAFGATDRDGEKVVEHPVTVPELFATWAALLGLDPGRSVLAPSRRPLYLVDHADPVRALIAALP